MRTSVKMVGIQIKSNLELFTPQHAETKTDPTIICRSFSPNGSTKPAKNTKIK